MHDSNRYQILNGLKLQYSPFQIFSNPNPFHDLILSTSMALVLGLKWVKKLD
jgi:hypothetical protein